MIAWADGRDDIVVRYGAGAQYATAQVRVRQTDGRILPSTMYIQSSGIVYVAFSNLKVSHPFDGRDKRDELRARLAAAVPTAAIPSEDARVDATIPLAVLADPEVRQRFAAAMDWAFEEARRSQHLPPE